MDVAKSIRYLILVTLFILCSSCATVDPKTCMTSCTDNDITTNVQTLIYDEKCLGDQDIHVCTYDRVVTLSGTVENPTQANVAVILAKRIYGVRGVISNLKIDSARNCQN